VRNLVIDKLKSEPERRWRHKVTVTLAALLLLPEFVIAENSAIADTGWDATVPRGPTRNIDFVTTAASWMSLTISPDGKIVAFDLLGNIYSISSKGGDATCLTCEFGISINYHPAISPDGRHIAFVSDRSGQDNLWVMDTNGSGQHAILLDDQSRFAEPAWLDSNTIVATRKLNTSWGIYVRNDTLWSISVDSGAARRLAPARDPDFDPQEYLGPPRFQWPSPDRHGGWLYFGISSFAGDDRHLQRLNLATGMVQDVTESKLSYRVHGSNAEPMPLGEAAPEISPDGRQLAFIRRFPGAYLQVGSHKRSGRSALWIRDLTTGAERVVMDPVTYDAMAMQPQWKTRVAPGYQWASDGQSIVISKGGGIQRLWLADGRIETIPFRARVFRRISGQVRSLVAIDDRQFEPRDIRSLTTSPNQAEVVFEAAGQLWHQRTRGGAATSLTARRAEFQRYPSWSHDGRSLAFVDSDGAGHSEIWRYEGNREIQLTSDVAEYVHPFFSPDGKFIFASRWTPGLARVVPRVADLRRDGSDDPRYWQLVRLPSAGGSPMVVAETGACVDIGFDARGRILFIERGLDAPATSTELISIAGDGSDRQVEAFVRGDADAVVPSPDRQFIAIEKWGDIYLARRGEPAHVWDVLSNDVSLKRLSRRGGVFPHWLDSSRLEYTSAQTLMTYDVRSGHQSSLPIRLAVPRAGGNGSVVFKNARIVTLGSSGVVENGDLVVKDHRIACVGSCSSAGSRIIDARGRTLIPGWFDLHAHQLVGDQFYLPVKRAESAASLAYGVTTVHDPFSLPNPSFALHDLIESGRLTGPRSYSTGYAIPCTAPGFETNRPMRTPQDAEDEVFRRTRMGVISIKDFRVCTRIERQWIIEAARQAGVTVTNEGAEPEFLLGEIMSGATGWEHPIELNPMYQDLTKFLGMAHAHYSQQFMLTDHPFGLNVTYFEGQRDLWTDPKFARWTNWKDLAMRRNFGGKPIEEYSFPIQGASAYEMVKEGSYLTLGSHGMFNGLGMHWEVWAYASGSSALAALTAASLNGAHFLGLESQLGTLEAGKLADIIVLKSNPLEDIHNTLDIEYVMKAGILYNGMTLDEVWPEERPYGERPWDMSAIHRTDSRPD
jgi:imidazolonepropionase-like amidohydrolase/Tol biopolymer transport system component